ncbi:hypothetical protein ACFJGV_07725 [Cnuibacter sp. UC19_7]|uniref:hypothetical protein n=1 Tax=Cnuibacter sp. UC19_7 TaxID=3350166 RepID=UPI00366CE17F
MTATAATADEPFPYATRIVRIYPDYADTVIWFSDPFPYEETGLTAELIERLSAWESTYYAAMTERFEWDARFSLHEFDHTGLDLAHAVADEIGPDFEVEYRSFENHGAVATLRAEAPAANPSARDAFALRALKAREYWASARHPGSPGSVTLLLPSREEPGAEPRAEFRPPPAEDRPPT